MRSEAGPASAAIMRRAERVIPGGANSLRRRTKQGLSIRRGSGAHVWDADGKCYIDNHCGYSAVGLGHAYPAVEAAVAAASADLTLPGIGTTEAEVELAERLVGHIAAAHEALVFSSGTEANLAALRLARATTGRRKLVKFAGHYHGGHDFFLASTETGRTESAGLLEAATATIVTCRFNDLDNVRANFRLDGARIAAVIVEPIGHNSNLYPEPGFLKGLRDITSEYGSLLIFDEVITWRHALEGYQDICGVYPDLTTIGKALGNGHPLAALVGPDWLMHRFATHPDGDVFVAGTYNGNVPSVTAGIATLDVMEAEPVHERMFRLGEAMRAGLRGVLEECGVPGVVTGHGSIYTMLFTETAPRSYDDVARIETDLFVTFRNELIERGVLEMPVPFVRAQVSYSHSDEDVARTLEASRDALLAARDKVAGRRA